jgi:ubiquinone/menaquinone biosynthesis C-methylase UbiE
MVTPSTNYQHGYSKATTSTHASRTVESDASFLIPCIKETDKILDVGCGPGSITVGLAALVPAGTVLGIDLSEDVLGQARRLASKAGLDNVAFKAGDLLDGLSLPDDSFDIVYTSQVFPHLACRRFRTKALAEIRRVLKPNGLFASRDAAELHMYPRTYDLDRLWAGNVAKSLRDKTVDEDAHLPGGDMPSLLRKSGFDATHITVGAGTTVYYGAESRKWFAERNIARLSTSDTYRQGWIRAGISEEEIEETRVAFGKWADDDDAWYIAIQAEVVARK